MTDEEFQTLVLEQLAKINCRLEGFVGEISSIRQELNGVKHNTSAAPTTKDDISLINAKCDVLNSRLFKQEAELYQLKVIK